MADKDMKDNDITQEYGKSYVHFQTLNQGQEIRIPDRMKNPVDMSDKLEGIISFDFDLTLDSSARRKEYKKQGLSGDKLKEAMDKHSHRITYEVDLTGMPFGVLCEYAAKAMVIETRGPWYKTPEQFNGDIEKADKAIVQLLTDGAISQKWNKLTTTPFYKPGKPGRKSDPSKVVKGISSKEEAMKLIQMLQKQLEGFDEEE